MFFSFGLLSSSRLSCWGPSVAEGGTMTGIIFLDGGTQQIRLRMVVLSGYSRSLTSIGSREGLIVLWWIACSEQTKITRRTELQVSQRAQ